ncbi:hypothetical protein [Staphylococcus phage HMGUsa2]|nr:hypothetical protein [Staphylococcus phage HMGUsa2]
MKEIKEIWKPIKKEYFNKYNFYVSNLGSVMINDRFSKIHVDRDGYLTVKINKKRHMVHRLVYEYFGTDFNKDYHIHHIDGNKQNNCIDNLECISPSEHNKRHHKDNTFNKYNRGYVLTDDERKAIASKYKPYKYTIPMLAKEYNISESTVERIIKKYKKD